MDRMNKVIAIEQAISLVKDGDTVMVGGFMGNGTPEKLIDALIASGRKNLTLISSDTAMPDRGIGRLVVNKLFRKIITTHIGLNKEAGRQVSAGETEIDLVPLGTLAERIRAAGFGLGGVLTPTGLGTLLEEGKEKITVDGKTYLLEKPLPADIALIYAHKADKAGNLVYKGSQNNLNNIMSTAAKITIVEAGQIVERGGLDPNAVMTPGVFVNYIVDGGSGNG